MITGLIGLVLLLFQFVLIARLILDWVGVLASGGGGELAARGRRMTHAVTEPVIAPVRRVLPPIRAGSVSIDLAFMVVFFGVVLLRSIVVNL